MAYHVRKHSRHQTQALPVTLRESGTFVWARGTVLNLSQGGVLIHSSATLQVGTKLEIEFSTVDRQGRKNRRKMVALIKWKKAQRYGCEFKVRAKSTAKI